MTPNRNRTGRSSLCFWFISILVVTVALYEHKPPAALGVNASADQFSAGRAMEHVRQIGLRPHSIGTEENHRVRDYLVRQLRGLGGDVGVETTTGIQGRVRLLLAATVQNIVGNFPRSANNRAVMLAVHYDSVERGPGASDDGSGVAAILETLRGFDLDLVSG
jgi:acetylornithine deacetylase/succinyl-diaminopimelate desuccinylase-like protein